MHPAFAETEHRPWPLPPDPWLMQMRWSDLAFLHWRTPYASVRALVPPDLEIDTFEGEAWIGVVPFRMEGTRARLLPGIPSATNFPELNVRTYVRGAGKSGVWFFSLDAASVLAVLGARWLVNLPYFNASMQVDVENETIRYSSTRTHREARQAEFVARYRATGEVFIATPGSLENWLTERYCLFAPRRRGGVRIMEIHHQRWRLREAEADLQRNSMVTAAGLPPTTGRPLAHMAEPQDVVAWAPSLVD